MIGTGREFRSLSWKAIILVSGVVAALAGCAMWGGITLQGSQETPPVTSAAKGKGKITVAPDHTVSGNISVSGFTATAAHIHKAPPGKNGPVIIPLTKTGDNKFAVPEGAKLTDTQYAAYQAGALYVNVHSAAHPNGELRAQLTPAK